MSLSVKLVPDPSLVGYLGCVPTLCQNETQLHMLYCHLPQSTLFWGKSLHSSKALGMDDQRARAVIRPMQSVITEALCSWEERLTKYGANSFSFGWCKTVVLCNS